MKKISLIITVMVAILLATAQAKEESPEFLFQKALYLETSQADYTGAVKIYETLIVQVSEDQKMAKKTLERMRICYEKLGNQEKAAEILRKQENGSMPDLKIAPMIKIQSIVPDIDQPLTMGNAVHFKIKLTYLLSQPSGQIYLEIKDGRGTTLDQKSVPVSGEEGIITSEIDLIVPDTDIVRINASLNMGIAMASVLDTKTYQVDKEYNEAFQNPEVKKLYYQGKLAFHLKHTTSEAEECKKSLEKALALEPKNVSILREIAFLYINRYYNLDSPSNKQAHLKTAQRYIDQAKEVLRQKDARDVFLLTLEGFVALENKDYENAYALSVESFRISPRYYYAWAGKIAAESALYLKRYDEAIKICEEASSYRPSNDIYKIWGEALEKKGDLAKAAAIYQYESKDGTGSDKTLRAKNLCQAGRLYLKMGEVEKAKGVLIQAHKADPYEKGIAAQLAELFQSARDIESARKYLEIELSLDKGNETIKKQLANIGASAHPNQAKICLTDKVYILPLGDIDSAFLDKAVALVKDYMEINIIVLDRVKIPEGCYDQQRQQYESKAIITKVLEPTRNKYKDGIGVIGVLSEDLYRYNPGYWVSWVFGDRQPEKGIVLWTTKRAKTQENLAKLLLRGIGTLALKSDEPSDDPRCAMSPISNTQELTLKQIFLCEKICAEIQAVNKKEKK